MSDLAAACAYPGSELDLFAHAENWRAYWSAQVLPFLGPRVLEVGAGLGTITAMRQWPKTERWLALEPDHGMAAGLADRCRAGSLPAAVEARHGTTRDLDRGERFDTILYIDVLEHIDDDRGELARAAAHLAPGGHLVVLSPAHQFLYSPFDAAIGHVRRYRLAQLTAAGPPGLTLRLARYLDSVGLLASLANRLLLRAAQPTLDQILLWDRWMVRSSRLVDPLLGYRLGKSVLAVWRNPAG